MTFATVTIIFFPDCMALPRVLPLERLVLSAPAPLPTPVRA